MALAARVQEGAHDAYEALSTADIKFPTVTLSTGEQVQVTYGKYRELLDTQPGAGRSGPGVHHAPRDVCRTRQHVCGALRRGPAARLVLGAVAPLQDHAGRGPVRQRDSTGGHGHPDRDGAGRGGTASRVPSPAPALAEARHVSHLRHRRADRSPRHTISVRRGARLAGRLGRPARGATTRPGCVPASRAAGSTSTRTRASGPGPIPRPCTAYTRTCSSTTTTRWIRCSRWPTRWATRCTRCSATRASRSSTRTTRSSSPRCPRP